ncbi:hypothetical protein [Mongoliitalea lutea]|uniref:hypothetical protein n=1 Tax=Mongoliitalea lutea TaxID=849756 RepID=UPI001673B270|nr:hypothetical protein [Mongoliitalea lutea]
MEGFKHRLEIGFSRIYTDFLLTQWLGLRKALKPQKEKEIESWRFFRPGSFLVVFILEMMILWKISLGYFKTPRSNFGASYIR